MSVTVVAFFNNKGGVGKTSLVYHLAWMFADRGKRVLAVDLDPQANLSAFFIDEDKLALLWPEEDSLNNTIFTAVHPLLRGVGDVSNPYLEPIQERLALIPGDMQLSRFENDLSVNWSECLDRKERGFRVMSAFWRVIQAGAREHQADIALVDLGPNLGAINRAALISADYVVIPLGPDLFSLKGLRNLGPTLRQWRTEWKERFSRNPDRDLIVPPGEMQPIGYIMLQHSVRLDRPAIAYGKWIAKIPAYYRKYVLDQPVGSPLRVENDEHCFAMLKHYRSLMPMAQESRKPMFFLKPSDGAIGAHANAIPEVYADFQLLARKIGKRAGVILE
jgi:chromosome partitioning protein